MNEPQRMTVPVGGGRVLDVLLSGPPNTDTTLVFHYGSPCGLVPLASALAPALEGIRTLLYARPAYSASSPHLGRRVADAAADTAAVLDAVGAERFVNVGWSGGGPHALACDALLPDRCLATAVIGSLSPYVGSEAWPEIKVWYEDDEDNQLALSGDVDGFRRNCAALAKTMSRATAEGVRVNAKSAADRAYLSLGYSEWIASMFREAFSTGGDGFADDFLAFFLPWGFSLADTRRVAIWHGTDDQNVPIAHAYSLAAQMPKAGPHILDDEGHVSIMQHFSAIIHDLLNC